MVAAGDGANFLAKKKKKLKGKKEMHYFKKEKKIIHRRIEYIVVLFVSTEYKSQQGEKFEELQGTAALQPSLRGGGSGGWTVSD